VWSSVCWCSLTVSRVWGEEDADVWSEGVSITESACGPQHPFGEHLAPFTEHLAPFRELLAPFREHLPRSFIYLFVSVG
jgi:hypothetical protein